jgi:hypothetical protein
VDGLMIVLLLVIIFIAAVWLYIAKQGDAEFAFLVDQRTPWVIEALYEGSATFSVKVPFINRGSQDGTIMDAYTRHLLPYEQYDAVEVYSRLTNEELFRSDGYWEAVIVPKHTGGTVIVTVRLTAKAGSIEQALADMVDMSVDIVYQIVARSPWYISKNRLLFNADEARLAFQRKQDHRRSEEKEVL